MMQILVLEASTASAKAMLYSAERGVVAVKTRSYGADCGDIAVQDPDRVCDAVLAVGRELAEGREIDAVALSGTWHSLLICDGKLNAKSAAYSWAYTGGEKAASVFRRDPERAMALYRRTGGMPNAIYPVYRLIHLREQGVFPSPGDLVTSQGGYLFSRLTGELLESRSTASGSGFLNIRTLRWDGEMAALAGVSLSNLPPLAEHTDTRPLRDGAAKALGVRPGVPVVTAHPDGALNQVGAGAMGPSVMTLSVGTSGAMRLSYDRPVIPDEPGTWCYYAPGKWLIGAAISGCTNCVDWFVKTLMGSRLSYGELEEQAARAADSAVFLPFLFGERCPGWQDTRRGGFAGLNGSSGAGSLYLGILEGISFNLLQCYEILSGLCGVPERVCLSGGVLKSPLWTRLLCDILGRPMLASENEQASMLGAAALGLLNAGGLASLPDFPADGGRLILPDESKAELYRRRYERYLDAYSKNQ